MKNIRDLFKVAGIVSGIIVVIMLLFTFSWGWSQASDVMSMDPATNRSKRIEKKLDEMDLKLDQLIKLGKKWE